MPIVSSVIQSQTVQKNGIIAVVEVHTDQINVVYNHLYNAAATDNLQTNLNNWAALLNTQLPANEINANIVSIEINGASAVITTNYNTLSQIINAVLGLFASVVGTQCMNLSAWLNTLTFAQLSAASPTKFPNATAFVNWRNSFVTPSVNALTTVNGLVGG